MPESPVIEAEFEDDGGTPMWRLAHPKKPTLRQRFDNASVAQVFAYTVGILTLIGIVLPIIATFGILIFFAMTDKR